MTLEELKIEWLESKALEGKCKNARLDIENQILALAKDLPEKGTKEICNGMKLTTGFSKSYDQEQLMELYASNKMKNFPFEKTFKPVNADLKYIEKNDKEAFMLIEKCATMTPKKVAFKAEE